MHTLQSEAMSDIKYEDMADIYLKKIIMNRMKWLYAGVDSYINKCYSVFFTLKDIYMMRQQIGETATNYFDHFKSARVNTKLSKEKLTKHIELEKSEMGDGNNTNP